MREKLIELMKKWMYSPLAVNGYEGLADYLLQNSVVMIQRGEWIEKEHWVPLARDYEVSSVEYEDYDEKTHSMRKEYWHCSYCDYEASRDTKPQFKYCPNCGAKMEEKTE